MLKLTIEAHRVLDILPLCCIKIGKQNIYELNSASQFFLPLEMASLCAMVCINAQFRCVPSQCDIP